MTWYNATFSEIVGKVDMMLETKPFADDLEITNEEKAEAFLELYINMYNLKDTLELVKQFERAEEKYNAIYDEFKSFAITREGVAKTMEYNRIDFMKVQEALEYTGNFARRS